MIRNRVYFYFRFVAYRPIESTRIDGGLSPVETSGSLSRSSRAKLSLFDRLDQQRMILVVDRCFYLVTLFNFPLHVGGFISVQTNFRSIPGLDKIIGIINAEQFASNRLLTACTALPIFHVLLFIIIGLKIVFLSIS